MSCILVSPSNPKVVATRDSVVTGALGGIFADFFYYNYGCDYITKPCRKYYGRLVNRLGI